MKRDQIRVMSKDVEGLAKAIRYFSDTCRTTCKGVLVRINWDGQYVVEKVVDGTSNRSKSDGAVTYCG